MKTTKKMISILLALVLGAGSIFSSATNASAAGKALGKLNLNWDLKNGKSYEVPIRLPVINKKGNGTIQIKNLKKANAKKKGYKKITFIFECHGENIKLSNEEIVDLCQSPAVDVGEISDKYVAIIDYASGMSLDTKNKYQVTVKSSSWKTTYYPKQHSQYYEGEKLGQDWWWRCIKMSKIKVTITYPKSYKNLCIGIGETVLIQNYMSDFKESKNDKAFWKGKTSFAKTDMYKKWKKYAHFMRIK